MLSGPTRSTAVTEPLALTLAASPPSPVENVALVVKGWGEGGKGFRVGQRRRLEATDLVVFATARSTSPLRLVLAPN